MVSYISLFRLSLIEVVLHLDAEFAPDAVYGVHWHSVHIVVLVC